jgi:asparagine synthase (glutamine-hydrolysing)
VTRSPRRSLARPDGGPALKLRILLRAAVRTSRAEGILLSGGLDTSILAHLASECGLVEAVTVVCAEDAPDREHAARVARRLGLEHHVVDEGLEGALREAPLVCHVMRTFDPMEVRNSAVVARALREARVLDVQRVMTGDGADELFGGYSFMWTKDAREFAASTARMSRIMRFSSVALGRALGVEVVTPFLDPRIREFALTLSKDDVIGERGGTLHGKLILREAFPDVGNRWRRKDPIETGSGSARAPEFFRGRVTEEVFQRERRRILGEDGVEIRDPEHLAYYDAFVRVFRGRPPLVRDGRDPCPKCRYEMPSPDSDFCVTCGAWPVPQRV